MASGGIGGATDGGVSVYRDAGSGKTVGGGGGVLLVTASVLMSHFESALGVPVG